MRSIPREVGVRFFLPLFLVFLPLLSEARSPDRSLLLVGWDGADRGRLRELLDADKLPNLALLVSSGSLVDTLVTTGATETKCGWAEILSGLSADAMGIENNRVYRSIPKGETVFERWREEHGRDVCSVFIGGKINNIGCRGPHEICINCQLRDSRTREETYWWDRKRNVGRPLPGLAERWVSREGEPFFHATAALDTIELGLDSADKVGPAAIAAIDACGKRPFFAFVHFEDPDEMGHVYGEASNRYLDGFVAADIQLGHLLAAIERSGRRSTTTVIVTTDHGMDAASNEHHHAPRTWLASDRPGLRSGDRKDVGATLFQLLGLAAPGRASRALTQR